MVSATSASRKVAFINGAERAEIYHRARLLALQGTHVVLASKEWSKAVDASLRLQLEGLSAEALHLDARDLGNLAGVRHQLAKRHGRLDFIIDDGATTAA
jgi:NAD(P)-dependent dehydrogenase (short-subunit alcohol dehydrogenase family)